MADIDQLAKRANEAFLKGNFDYARDLFLQILLLDPNHAQYRKELYANLVKKFQTQGAPGKLKQLAMKAQIETQFKITKDPAKRADICQKHLSEDPKNSRVRAELAAALLQMGHVEGAAAEGEITFQIDPANIPSAKVLVEAYSRLNKVKEAQWILEKVASAAKDDRDIERLQRNLAALQTMKKGFEGGAEGKDGFRSAMKNVGQAQDLEKAQHLIKTDDDVQAMVEGYEKEFAGNATAQNAKKLGDFIFDRKKDYKAAQEWYRKAAELNPQDSVLRDKSDDCDIRLWDARVEAAVKASDPKLAEIRSGRLKTVIQSYERRVKDRPTDMGLRYELGKAYLQLPGHLDKAIGEFQQAVKDPKRKAEAHFYLGRAFQSKKMYDIADKQYEGAFEGVLSQQVQLNIMYYRAICAADSGNKAKAIDIGKKILEIEISYRDMGQMVEKWEQETR